MFNCQLILGRYNPLNPPFLRGTFETENSQPCHFAGFLRYSPLAKGEQKGDVFLVFLGFYNPIPRQQSLQSSSMDRRAGDIGTRS